MSMTAYQQRIQEIGSRSAAVKAVVLEPQLNEDGQLHGDVRSRIEGIAQAASADPMFEALGEHASAVALGWASAIEEYVNIHGEMPRDEVLASAHATMENMMMYESKGDAAETQCDIMLESVAASTQTSEGVILRANNVGMILPVLLTATTGDACTFIPAGRDETEIFEVRRVAGNGWGGLEEGALIDEHMAASYGHMAQRFKMKDWHASFAATGVKQVFDVGERNKQKNASGSYVARALQLKKKRVVIRQDGKELYRDELGQDTVNVNITIMVEDKPAVFTIDKIGISDGKLSMSTKDANGISKAVPDDLYFEYEIDVQRSTAGANGVDNIPTVTHDMRSYKVFPHESILAAEHTIQSYWAMSREYGVDLTSMEANHVRNMLAHQKDVRNLKDMYELCPKAQKSEFDITTRISDGATGNKLWAQYFKEHYELLRQVLLDISQQLVNRTKVSGLVGMFAGLGASTIIKSIGAPFFEPVAGYQQRPQIHYIGRLFGWKVYECPIIVKKWDILCYARGSQHTQAGYVVGDAVPPIMYRHPTTPTLRDRNTLWELSYGDVHPRNGLDFFHVLTITGKGAIKDK